MKGELKPQIVNVFKTVFVLTAFSMIVLTSVFLNEFPKLVAILSLVIFTVLLILIAYTNPKNHEAVYKAMIIILFVCVLLLIGYILTIKTELGTILENPEQIFEVIRNTGYLGIFLFILFIILQVIFLPIPAAVPAFLGSQLYGPIFAFIYMSIGTIIGSIITFALGKIFGVKLVKWVIGEEKTDKYAKLLNKKGKPVFIALMIIPFTPDDLICLIAGMTKMTYKFFIISISITRPLLILITCFLFEGNIIPFSGWGIPVWIAIFALSIVLCIVLQKLSDKFLASRGKRKKEGNNEKLENKKHGA